MSVILENYLLQHNRSRFLEEEAGNYPPFGVSVKLPPQPSPGA